MAIDYAGSPNGLFVRFGKIIRRVNSLEVISDTDSDTYLEDVQDTYYATTGATQNGAAYAIVTLFFGAAGPLLYLLRRKPETT